MNTMTTLFVGLLAVVALYAIAGSIRSLPPILRAVLAGLIPLLGYFALIIGRWPGLDVVAIQHFGVSRGGTGTACAMAMKLPARLGLSLGALASMAAMVGPLPAEASCGSVLLRGDRISTTSTDGRGADGQPDLQLYADGGAVWSRRKHPVCHQGERTLTLANLNVNRINTMMRTATLDLNYGLTERLGIQVAIPYKHVESDAPIGGLTPVPYSERGLGDIRATLKYNALPTLRSMVVLGVGADFPTGSYGRFAQGSTLAESTLQIGRGNFGIIPMIYQTTWTRYSPGGTS